MTPSDVRSLLASKGWLMVDVAARWGMSTPWMSRLVNDPARPARYNDAFAGLPERHAVTVQRAARHKRSRQGARASHGSLLPSLEQSAAALLFEAPRILVALDDTYLEEGARVVVTGNSAGRLQSSQANQASKPPTPLIHMIEPEAAYRFSLPQDEVVLRFGDTGLEDSDWIDG